MIPTDEEFVRSRIPDATIYGWGHGKVRVESPTRGVLSDMMYLGTREKRREDAWVDAAKRLKEVPMNGLVEHACIGCGKKIELIPGAIGYACPCGQENQTPGDPYVELADPAKMRAALEVIIAATDEDTRPYRGWTPIRQLAEKWGIYTGDIEDATRLIPMIAKKALGRL